MPCSAKNPLLKKSATQNERNFRVDFYAEDAIRLSPYKDDKLKYAENTPFGAGSDYFRLPKRKNFLAMGQRFCKKAALFSGAAPDRIILSYCERRATMPKLKPFLQKSIVP